MNWDYVIHLTTAISLASVIYMVGGEFKRLKAEIISLKCQMSRGGEHLYTIENRLSNLNGFSKEAWDLMNKTALDIENLTKDVVKYRLCMESCKDSMSGVHRTLQSYEKHFDKWENTTNKIVKEWPKFSLVEKQYDKFKKDIRDVKSKLTKSSKVLESTTKEALSRMHHVGMKSAQIDDKYLKSATWVADIARDFHTLAMKFKTGEIKEVRILSKDEYLSLRKINA